MGLSRLMHAPTWDRWQWQSQVQKFTTAAAFRYGSVFRNISCLKDSSRLTNVARRAQTCVASEAKSSGLTAAGLMAGGNAVSKCCPCPSTSKGTYNVLIDWLMIWASRSPCVCWALSSREIAVTMQNGHHFGHHFAWNVSVAACITTSWYFSLWSMTLQIWSSVVTQLHILVILWQHHELRPDPTLYHNTHSLSTA